MPLSLGCSRPAGLRPAPLDPHRHHTPTPVQLAWRNQESLMPEIAGKSRPATALAAGASLSPEWGWGGCLQLWKFPPAQLEKGPASQHQGHQMPGVSRSWSINGQERHPSSVSEFCVCASHARSLATFLSARRGPAVDCGTQSESKLRGLLGGQGWLWLDVGHCGSNLTCCPQGWDSSGSLRQLWGGREKCVPSPSLLWDSGV